MKDQNYTLFLIHEKNIKIEKMDNIPVHGNMGTTNYLFIPRDAIELFKDLMINKTSDH
jgi:hypothetical protein